MKMFKKVAAVLLSAVLAVSMLAGCSAGSSNRNYEVEQRVVSIINQERKSQNTGLEELENDADLQAKAMKILDACAAKQMQTRPFGTGYVLTKAEVEQVVGETVTINYGLTGTNVPMPAGLYLDVEDMVSDVQEFFLVRRMPSDLNDYYYNYGAFHYSLLRRTNMKIGVAAREINGETFMLVLWRAL